MTTQFNWLLYLEVAEHLLRQRPLGEEFHRSAVNRAYYGVFCHIRDTLQSVRGGPFSTRSDVHQQVIDALQNDPRQEVRELGEELDALCRERNRADYRTALHFVVSRSRSSVSRARAIRNRVNALFP